MASVGGAALTKFQSQRRVHHNYDEEEEPARRSNPAGVSHRRERRRQRHRAGRGRGGADGVGLRSRGGIVRGVGGGSRGRGSRGGGVLARVADDELKLGYFSPEERKERFEAHRIDLAERLDLSGSG